MELEQFRKHVEHDLKQLHQKIKEADDPKERAEALRKYSNLWRTLKKW